MFLAKPHMTNSLYSKTFKNKDDAVAYLTQFTGHDFPYPVKPHMLPKSVKKLKEQFNITPEERLRRINENEVTYPDWELLGKLTRIENE